MPTNRFILCYTIMAEQTLIPMFPLNLLPLPGEIVPLHIFEPRYRELLEEAETSDRAFGIFFSHDLNKKKLGSLMKLERVIKRYPTGESDIIVKCVDVFTMSTLFRNFKSRSYPGGDVVLHNLNQAQAPSEMLVTHYLAYLTLLNIHNKNSSLSIFQIAHELNLDLGIRYKFLLADAEKKQIILSNELRILSHVVSQELKSKDVYHLN